MKRVKLFLFSLDPTAGVVDRYVPVTYHGIQDGNDLAFDGWDSFRV